MKTYVWALYASLLLYSCGANSTNRQDNKEDASTEQTQKAKKEQGLVTLDITKDYPEKKIVLQDLADVKYIPLETKKNALLTNSTAMLGYVSDSLIVAFTLEKEIVLFNGDGQCAFQLQSCRTRQQRISEYHRNGCGSESTGNIHCRLSAEVSDAGVFVYRTV